MTASEYGDIARVYMKFKNSLADYDEFLDSPGVYALIEKNGLGFEANNIYSSLKMLMDSFLTLLEEAEEELKNAQASSDIY
jgi:hypothetical protein